MAEKREHYKPHKRADALSNQRHLMLCLIRGLHRSCPQLLSCVTVCLRILVIQTDNLWVPRICLASVDLATLRKPYIYVVQRNLMCWTTPSIEEWKQGKRKKLGSIFEFPNLDAVRGTTCHLILGLQFGLRHS